MSRRWGEVGAVSGATLLLTLSHCSSFDEASDPGVVGADGGGDVMQPPDGCDPNADPKDAPNCVVNSYGIFVDATSGADTNTGTKESPFKTIGGALNQLASKSRVYVCAGTYPEHVKLTTAVSIYGGFTCGAWSYSGDKAKVAPTDAGPALTLNATPSGVVTADLEITAQAATADAKNSIAVLAINAAGATFTRCALTAGAGFDGKPGDTGAPGTPNMSLDGNGAMGIMQGAGKSCTCSTGGTTSGGGGGGIGADGQVGGMSIAENPPGQDGAPGKANTGCSDPEPPKNGSGQKGANAAGAADASAVSTLGILGVMGWTPSAGVAGTAGTAGQGGGGGGGRTGPGGGGACGGCGGTGGKGGEGGGASVALAAFHSTVTLATTTLTGAKAGDGGAGGAGGGGGNGGSAGSGSGTGCGGGDGGKGGNGGGGSGGAGGVSAAVLYAGTKPNADGTSTLTPGMAGAKGAAGGAANAGPDGTAGTFVEAPEQ